MAITGTASPLNPAQQTNLDINLAPKTNNTEPISSSSNLDLNLDITLPKQSENNDWLQTEDQKNETMTDKEEMIQPVASGGEEVKPTNNITENKTPQA